MAIFWRSLKFKAVWKVPLLCVILFKTSCTESIDKHLLTRVADSAGCAQTLRNEDAKLDCVLNVLYEGGNRREFFKDHSLGREGTYGEVTAGGLASLLREPPLGTEVLNEVTGRMERAPAHHGGALVGPGDIFWDLGSGTGRAVLQVVLTTEVDKSVGIELSLTRHQIAERAAHLLKGILVNATISEASSRWELIHGNIREYTNLDGDLKDATVIYMASLCFPEWLLYELGHFVPRLTAGTVLLSLKEISGCHRGLVTVRKGVTKTTWSKENFSPVWVYVVAPHFAMGAPPPASVDAARVLRAREEAASRIVVEGERRWDGHRAAGEAKDAAACVFEELYAIEDIRTEGEVDWARNKSLAGLVKQYDLPMSSKGEGGRTVAHVAVLTSIRSLSRVLELWPAAVHDMNDLGETPLHICGEIADESRTSVQGCQALLDAGAEIERPDLSGKTPLLRILSTCPGLNPRHTCARSAHVLVQRGANVSVADSQGTTALHYALKWGSQDMTRMIIKAAGDTATDAQNLLLQGDKDGNTPIHQLCSKEAEGDGSPLQSSLASWILTKVGVGMAAAALKVVNKLGQTPPVVCTASQKSAVLKMFELWEASAHQEAKEYSEVGVVERMRQLFQKQNVGASPSSWASGNRSHHRQDSSTATKGPSPVSARPDL